MAGQLDKACLESECEDCGCRKMSLTYQVIETKKLCKGCVTRRASKVLDGNDALPAGGVQEGKILSLKCEHCTAGICETCEAIVMRHLDKLQPEEVPTPRDIQYKRLVLTRRIQLPRCIKVPRMCCGVGKSKLAIVDLESGSLFLFDLKRCEVMEIVPSNRKMVVSDCRVVNRNELVLGNMAEGSLQIFNLQGKHLGDLPFPGQKKMKKISLGINKQGQLLAARSGESDIHAIDELAEKVVGKRSLAGKQVHDHGNIQVTSTNSVVVQTDWAEFTISDDSGRQQHTVTDANWHHAVCGVHHTSDLLYVLYSRYNEDPQNIYVDELSPQGEIKRKRLFRFKTSGQLSPPFINSDMEMFICDGSSILVYA